MQDRLLKRAGLDYHEYASVRRHASVQRWLDDERPDPARCFAFSRHGPGEFRGVRWQPGDWLIFGSETAGLPEDLRPLWPAAQWLRLPMRGGQRSLNLSNAVAVAVFEAWRQNGYAGAA
jgi:tRNA (cytidine/uridine-2'-O-)-methyltransferase